jgi:hypothetical protein
MAGTSLAIAISAQVGFDYRNQGAFPTSIKDRRNVLYQKTILNGQGANQAQAMFVDRRTLSAGSLVDAIDLAGGLADAFGNTITFTDVRGLWIRNLGSNDGDGTFTPATGEDIVIGAGTNSWDTLFGGVANGKLTITPNGLFLWTSPIDGVAIGAGATDVLEVVYAGAADVVFDFAVWGTV